MVDHTAIFVQITKPTKIRYVRVLLLLQGLLTGGGDLSDVCISVSCVCLLWCCCEVIVHAIRCCYSSAVYKSYGCDTLIFSNFVLYLIPFVPEIILYETCDASGCGYVGFIFHFQNILLVFHVFPRKPFTSILNFHIPAPRNKHEPGTYAGVRSYA